MHNGEFFIHSIINAIEKLENVSLLSEDNFQSSIEEAVNDEHSDLYRALNIPRISPITFLGQLGYKKCKSLMRAQDNHEAVVDSTIRQ